MCCPQLPFFPPLQRAEDFTEEVCRALICGAAGEGGMPDATIHSVRPWTMSAEVLAPRHHPTASPFL